MRPYEILVPELPQKYLLHYEHSLYDYPVTLKEIYKLY